MTPTRFDWLGYRKEGNLWRLVDRNTNATIGPLYRTKAELLADLEHFNSVRTA